jgi:hypothetical protein
VLNRFGFRRPVRQRRPCGSGHRRRAIVTRLHRLRRSASSLGFVQRLSGARQAGYRTSAQPSATQQTTGTATGTATAWLVRMSVYEVSPPVRRDSR